MPDISIAAITWTPTFHLRITLEQIKLALECSQNHYDETCKAASGTYYSSANRKAFLTAAFNTIVSIPDRPVELTNTEIDILCKVLEIAHTMSRVKKEMGAAMRSQLRAIHSRHPQHLQNF